MTELLKSHNKTLTGEELLLLDEQRKWFLEMECGPGKDAIKIVEMTTENIASTLLTKQQKSLKS